MSWSHARFAKKAGLRAALVSGLVAVLAMPAAPSAAQPSASTPPNCVIQLSVSNPVPGDQEIPRTLQMSGTAVDDTATSGNGISNIQVFLGDRNLGGLFIGSTTPGGSVSGAWSITTSIPETLSGGQNMFVYGTSAVSGQQAFVTFPIVVAASQTGESAPSSNFQSFCPATMPPANSASTPAAG